MGQDFIRRVMLISQFELRRFCTTRKGGVSIAVLLVVWYLILRYPLSAAVDVLRFSEKGQTSPMLDAFGVASMLDWQVPELAVFWRLSLYLLPLLAVLLSADQMASDRENGTLRLLCLRCSRDEMFIGRFVGSVAVQLLVLIFALLSCWLLALWNDQTILAQSWQPLLIITLNLILLVLPFTAFMAVLSASVHSARQAILWVVLLGFFSSALINVLTHFWPMLVALKMLLPGFQMAQLAQLSLWQTLSLSWVPLFQTLVFLVIGRQIMQWRAL